MQIDKNELDRHITGNYGEDQFIGVDEEDGTEEPAPPLTPYAAIQASIFDLLHQRFDWKDREDKHGVKPWIEQRLTALTQAQHELIELREIKKALAVLKASI